MKTFKGIVPKPASHQHIIAGATSVARIKLLCLLAADSPDKEYIIPYSRNTYDLPGNLEPKDIAHMFAKQLKIPANIIFEESFKELIDQIKSKQP